MKNDVVFSKKAQKIKAGVYQHYKGQKYRVLGVAVHTETRDEFVVYIKLYGKPDMFVRPLDMFLEKVIVEDVEKDRFKFVK